MGFKTIGNSPKSGRIRYDGRRTDSIQRLREIQSIIRLEYILHGYKNGLPLTKTIWWKTKISWMPWFMSPARYWYQCVTYSKIAFTAMGLQITIYWDNVDKIKIVIDSRNFFIVVFLFFSFLVLFFRETEIELLKFPSFQS